MPDPKSRMEGCRKLKISRKEAHDTGHPCKGRKVKHLLGGNFGVKQLVWFTGTSISNRELVYNGDV